MENIDINNNGTIESIKNKKEYKRNSIKIYLSGASNNKKAEDEINNAEKEIRRIINILQDSVQCEVINPLKSNINKSTKWKDTIKNNIKLLVDADILVDMDNDNYKSSMLEKIIATSLDIKIIPFNMIGKTLYELSE